MLVLYYFFKLFSCIIATQNIFNASIHQNISDSFGNTNFVSKPPNMLKSDSQMHEKSNINIEKDLHNLVDNVSLLTQGKIQHKNRTKIAE